MLIYMVANGDVHHEAFVQKPYTLLDKYNATSDGSFRIVGLSVQDEEVEKLQAKISKLYKMKDNLAKELEHNQNRVIELLQENYRQKLRIEELEDERI